MIRAGILGLGRIGHGFGVGPGGDPLSHSAAYARVPEVILALGADPAPEARAAFAARFPGALCLPNPDEAPLDLRLDVVSVASPTEAHGRSVASALRFSPRVILAEKPLAPTAAEAEAIAARCHQAGCLLVVNYSRRFAPLLPALRAAVPTLGRPLGASLRYGGGLVHNGTHWIDLLAAVLGPPQQASCSERDAGGADSLVLRWDGAVAHLIAARGTGFSVGEGELWGPGGLLRMTASGARLAVQRPVPSDWPGFQRPGPEQTLCDDGLRGHLENAVRAAVALASAGGEPPCSAADAVLALRLCEQARSGA